MADRGSDRNHVASEIADLESAVALIRRARAGDSGAKNRLLARSRQALARWAHGRLPSYARERADTDDLVQTTLVRALEALEKSDGFEPRHEGAFLAFLRQILLNEIRDEIRRARRRPARGELDESLAHAGPTPLEEAIGRDFMARYECGLSQLSSDQRKAVVLRLEFGLTYREIAEALRRPSANAARLMTSRAIAHVARVLELARPR